MYMPNVKILRWGPNTTYIPLTVAGGWRRVKREKFSSDNAKDTNMLVFFVLGIFCVR